MNFISKLYINEYCRDPNIRYEYDGDYISFHIYGYKFYNIRSIRYFKNLSLNNYNMEHRHFGLFSDMHYGIVDPNKPLKDDNVFYVKCVENIGYRYIGGYFCDIDGCNIINYRNNIHLHNGLF